MTSFVEIWQEQNKKPFVLVGTKVVERIAESKAKDIPVVLSKEVTMNRNQVEQEIKDFISMKDRINK